MLKKVNSRRLKRAFFDRERDHRVADNEEIEEDSTCIFCKLIHMLFYINIIIDECQLCCSRYGE